MPTPDDELRAKRNARQRAYRAKRDASLTPEEREQVAEIRRIKTQVRKERNAKAKT